MQRIKSNGQLWHQTAGGRVLKILVILVWALWSSEILWIGILRSDLDSDFQKFNQIQIFREFLMTDYKVRPDITVNVLVVSVTSVVGVDDSYAADICKCRQAHVSRHSDPVIHLSSYEEGQTL